VILCILLVIGGLVIGLLVDWSMEKVAAKFLFLNVFPSLPIHFFRIH